MLRYLLTQYFLKKSGGEFGRRNVRKFGQLITFWTALLFIPINGLTLGLGEIEVSTFLNQPLKAEIEVVSARPGEVDDLLVSLASRDAFRKAGLERPADLSKLRFKVEKSEDGQSAKILITTKTPIKEPFLNFLVEADWAKGRLLREFTILLDPPYFAQQPAPPAVAPALPPRKRVARVARQLVVWLSCWIPVVRMTAASTNIPSRVPVKPLKNSAWNSTTSFQKPPLTTSVTSRPS